MAEVVIQANLERQGLLEQVAVASSGISSEEHGNPIDPRAKRALAARGYSLPAGHQAHRITDSELATTDVILAMTYHHYQALLRRGADPSRLRMLRQFDRSLPGQVPSAAIDIDDPWYGGPDDFEAALDQIEAAMPGVMRRVNHLISRAKSNQVTVDPADGWHFCADCDNYHWGQFGAAGLLIHFDGSVLLQLRSPASHHGSTWGLPGGARQQGEKPLAAALREAGEEITFDLNQVQAESWSIAQHDGWSYTTVVARASNRFESQAGNWETSEVRWFEAAELASHQLHPGFDQAWPSLQPLLGASACLIVDGANLVGSKPDGWWKDRAGAAVRLRDELAVMAQRGLAAASLPQSDAAFSPNRAILPPAEQPLGLTAPAGWWPRIVLVLEGQARGAGQLPGLRVVDAPGEGDAEIVRQTELALADATNSAGPVVVATADKALIAQVTAAGASVISPGALRRAM